MNRHERRKRAALDQRRFVRPMLEAAKGQLEINVLTPSEIMEHPQKEAMRCVAGKWLLRCARESAPCLICLKQRFSNDQFPATLMFARPADRSLKGPWLVAGICDDCIERPDFTSRYMAVVRRILPDGRTEWISHKAPQVLQ